MNKYATFITIALLLTPISSVLAHDDGLDDHDIKEIIETESQISETELKELEAQAGWLPDHPLYFLKSFGESIQRFITFDEEKKAELEASFADKRLAELSLARRKGLTKIVERLSSDYEKAVDRMENEIERYGDKVAHDVGEKIGRQFFAFNNSVNEGIYPSKIIIQDNKTLDLLSEYTNTTVFSPEELRDLVYELLTQTEETQDWEAKKEFVKLAERLIHEARKSLSPETEFEEDDDVERLEALALRIGVNTAKHVAVLEKVLENATEQSRTGLLKALNASQKGHAMAVLAVTKKARFEWENEGVKDLIETAKQSRENFREEIKDRFKIHRESIKDALKDNNDDNQTETENLNETS